MPPEKDIHHIDNFLMEMEVNEKGEIICIIKTNEGYYSIGVTEKDARSFSNLFRMNNMK